MEQNLESILNNVDNFLMTEKGIEICDVSHATRYLRHTNLVENQQKQTISSIYAQGVWAKWMER